MKFVRRINEEYLTVVFTSVLQRVNVGLHELLLSAVLLHLLLLLLPLPSPPPALLLVFLLLFLPLSTRGVVVQSNKPAGDS